MAKVLIGYSTCWRTREAFRRHGHTAYTCDLLPAREDDPRPAGHCRANVWNWLKEPFWDFALFHPMCTYLTVSAAWAFKDPDYDRYPHGGYHQQVKPGTLVVAGMVQALFDDRSLTLSGEPVPDGEDSPPADALGFSWHLFPAEHFQVDEK